MSESNKVVAGAEAAFREAFAAIPAQRARFLVAAKPGCPLVDIVFEDERLQIVDLSADPGDRAGLWSPAEALVEAVLDAGAPRWRLGAKYTADIRLSKEGGLDVDIRCWEGASK